MRAVDLTGQRFGRLVAAVATRSDRGERAWVCKCDCGHSVAVRTSSLRAGHKKGCGKCRRPTVIVGDRFGSWTVVALSKGRRWSASVTCDCGRSGSVDLSKLTGGWTTRCSRCAHNAARGNKHSALAPGVGAKNRLIAGYKSTAKYKGHAFVLSDDELSVLFSSACFYCGKPPSARTRFKRVNGQITYTGLDRVDNTLGYTPENVVPACSTCNYQKRDSDVDSFLSWVESVASHSLGMVRNGISTGTKHSIDYARSRGKSVLIFKPPSKS